MKFKDFFVVWNFLWCNQFSQALYNENDHVYIDKQAGAELSQAQNGFCLIGYLTLLRLKTWGWKKLPLD